MNITIFIAHMALGGAQRVCVNLANEFVAQGHQVTILVLDLDRDHDVHTHLLDKRCRIVSLGVSRIRYAAIPMIKYIRKEKPSFLMIFGNEMAIILNKLRKLHLIHVKMIVRVLNNLNISLSKEDHISPIVENYLKKAQHNLSDMEHLIAQCKGMEKMLIEGGFSSPDKITAIYNPVSEHIINAVNRSKKDKQENPVEQIVFIGRIDPQKNLTHLVKAFSKVHEKRPNTILRLIGDGNSRNSIEKCTEELGLADCVRIEGINPHIEEVYNEADVVALSSEYEGMPNCLIEAIGVGIPVVSYDCPLGPSEIIEDGVNGYLVPYNDIDALAQKLLLALERNWNPQEIKKTCDKFLVKNIANKYLQVFEKVERE
ncbi:MAG: glycosyltransferase [Lachnospiraceae bacterium]|nr:glycosyltransferase [Lachnospiraceae bacterium]